MVHTLTFSHPSHMHKTSPRLKSDPILNLTFDDGGGQMIEEPFTPEKVEYLCSVLVTLPKSLCKAYRR